VRVGYRLSGRLLKHEWNIGGIFDGYGRIVMLVRTKLSVIGTSLELEE